MIKLTLEHQKQVHQYNILNPQRIHHDYLDDDGDDGRDHSHSTLAADDQAQCHRRVYRANVAEGGASARSDDGGGDIWWASSTGTI